MVEMVKDGKNSPMYVYSQRDIEYLEKQGWSLKKAHQGIPLEELGEVQFYEDTEGEKIKQMAALLQPPKRGRPRKSP